MKLAGMSYNDILASGGGIQSTVQATRNASDNDLLQLVLHRLDQMMRCGTLMIEAKSGYGLNFEHEMRLLSILKQANELHPVSVIPTFGGAHVYPPEISRSKYLEMITDHMLPQVVSENLATSSDVFCDRGAFTVEETVQIFDTSSDLGLPIRVHAEELEYTGIGKIAAQEYGALSVDHLLLARSDDFQVYQEYQTVAMFMPMAPIGLFSSSKPQGFNQSGLIIGLGSDFNPNNWVISMQSAIRMAVYSYRLTPLQAFVAATTGSYRGITGGELPRLEQDATADLILLEGGSLAEIVSKFGQNLIYTVIKNGEILFSY
jgi:imidazolonepropionase